MSRGRVFCRGRGRDRGRDRGPGAGAGAWINTKYAYTNTYVGISYILLIYYIMYNANNTAYLLISLMNTYNNMT